MQEDVEFVVQRAHQRILRFLEKRSVITFAAAPGDDEVNAVLGEGFGESDPAHSTLLYAATSGSPPAGPAQKRAPVRMLRETETVPEPKGYLCARYFSAQVGAFPWKDGTRSIGLAPNALLFRLAALVPLHKPSRNQAAAVTIPGMNSYVEPLVRR